LTQYKSSSDIALWFVLGWRVSAVFALCCIFKYGKYQTDFDHYSAVCYCLVLWTSCTSSPNRC